MSCSSPLDTEYEGRRCRPEMTHFLTFLTSGVVLVDELVLYRIPMNSRELELE